MLSKRIRKIVIDKPEYVELIKKTAKRLEVGGKSSVFQNQEYRDMRLEENQLTGQLGECGAITTLFGFSRYIDKTNEKVVPGQGDGGNDIPGAYLPIDVKSTNVRIPNFHSVKELMYARALMVSKKEFNPNSIYIGCAVPEAPTHDDNYFEVWVMGWCWGHQMDYKEWYNEEMQEHRTAWKRKYCNLESMDTVPYGRKSWWDLIESRAA